MINLQKKRKILCAILASTMVMGATSIQAFAEEEQPEEPVTRKITISVSKTHTVYDYVTTSNFSVMHERNKSESKLYASSDGGSVSSNSSSTWSGKYKPMLDEETIAQGNKYHESLQLLKGTSVTVPKEADSGTYYFTGVFEGNRLVGEVKGIPNNDYQVIDYCPGIGECRWTYSNGRS